MFSKPLLFLVVIACFFIESQGSGIVFSPDLNDAPSGLLLPLPKGANPRPNEYIVALKKKTSLLQLDALLLLLNTTILPPGPLIPFRLLYLYNLTVFLGFAAVLGTQHITLLSTLSIVQYIEQNIQISNFTTTQMPTPSWGLDRIDQRLLPLNNTYTCNNTGQGITVYVMDSGIMNNHQQFQTNGSSRVFPGYSVFDSSDNGNTDSVGHGTHVAGIVGGNDYGVANGVRLIPVRVLDRGGSGSSAGVISGLSWIVSTAKKPSVICMSLGGPVSQAMDSSVSNTVAYGLPVVVSAGNEGVDACQRSPSRVPQVISVGAIDQNDRRAPFSNFGSCVSLFAPGTNIPSAFIGSPTNIALLSGSSMSTPFVAGVVAQYLSMNPLADPATIKSDVLCYSTKNVAKDMNNSPNRILFTPVGSNMDAAASVINSPTGSFEACAEEKGCYRFRGSLTNTNNVALQPNGTFYTVSGSGVHRGYLQLINVTANGEVVINDKNTDMDLYLYKYDLTNQKWVLVDFGRSDSSNEIIQYVDDDPNGGTFVWQLVLSMGSFARYRFAYKSPSSPYQEYIFQCNDNYANFTGDRSSTGGSSSTGTDDNNSGGHRRFPYTVSLWLSLLFSVLMLRYSSQDEL